ncbi:hypothetical protein AB1Y20_018407 [Prymnesium parvum]|uniref:Uncharacterized protein n=1 Tax=Prymnesium parvum TaxID=97485 RepID=A0AB34JNC0_PRYPA
MNVDRSAEAKEERKEYFDKLLKAIPTMAGQRRTRKEEEEDQPNDPPSEKQGREEEEDGQQQSEAYTCGSSSQLMTDLGDDGRDANVGLARLDRLIVDAKNSLFVGSWLLHMDVPCVRGSVG